MKKTSVAFQGEPGAYSEMAARLFFKKPLKIIPKTNFEEVFKAAGKSAFGIIPIENSLTGSIHENYDLLLQSSAPVMGEIKMRILHALIALPNAKLAGIKKIYSHPQAIAQCKDFLTKLKGVEIIPAYDTAGSVKMIKEKKLKGAAAIASPQAAIDYKMKVLRKEIETNKANYTRFLVLGHKRQKNAKRCKSSIVFAFKNVPGALFKCLGVFAMRDIDLIKIESRPIHGKPWAYIFYLDFAGNFTQNKIKNAMNHLAEITFFIKKLGTYPTGRVVEPKI